MPPVNPTGKIVYVCDEVLQDPTSGEFGFLGIFDDVLPSSASGYPFRLGRMCVAAQLVGGWPGADPHRGRRRDDANPRPRGGPFTGELPESTPSRDGVCPNHQRRIHGSEGVLRGTLQPSAFQDDRLLRLH